MPSQHWSNSTYSVTDRFGMGLILLATAYAAGILVLLRLLGIGSPMSCLAVGGMLVFVGVAQLVLRRFNRPRLVSMAAGAVFCTVWIVAQIVPFSVAISIGFAFSPVIWAVGALLGYVAGSVDASLFLVHDWLTLSRRLRTEAKQELATNGTRESPFDD